MIIANRPAEINERQIRVVVAIEMGANAEDLALSIHPHPTLSETIMEAAASLVPEAIKP